LCGGVGRALVSGVLALNSGRLPADGALVAALLLCDGESCQISWPWPEKLTGPERGCGACHALDSDGGKPITEVRGAAEFPWTASAAPEPADTGAPRSDGRAAVPPVVPLVEDVATGRREFVTGADRVAGFAFGCAVVAAGCDPPADPLPPK